MKNDRQKKIFTGRKTTALTYALDSLSERTMRDNRFRRIPFGNRPMARKKEYFEIKIEELQSLGKWAADCAEKALTIYENVENGDRRPRNAINGIRDFSNSGKRTNHLRKLALDAYRASLEAKDTAASAAAQSASLAAASAYTHPFKDINQSKHVLGPAVYSAFAIEQYKKSGQSVGDREIELAIDNATFEIAGLLNKMPAHEVGTRRIDQLFYELDRGIRNRFKNGSDHQG